MSLSREALQLSRSDLWNPLHFPKISIICTCSWPVYQLLNDSMITKVRPNICQQGELSAHYQVHMQANHAPCSVWPIKDKNFAIRENLHLSRENLHSSQSPTSRPDSGWSSAHIDRPDSGWSSTHVDPSPSQRWSRHGNVDFEAKKHPRWRHYISNILLVNQWDWQWLSIWHYHSAWVRKHIFLNIWQ